MKKRYQIPGVMIFCVFSLWLVACSPTETSTPPGKPALNPTLTPAISPDETLTIIQQATVSPTITATVIILPNPTLTPPFGPTETFRIITANTKTQ